MQSDFCFIQSQPLVRESLGWTIHFLTSDFALRLQLSAAERNTICSENISCKELQLLINMSTAAKMLISHFQNKNKNSE